MRNTLFLAIALCAVASACSYTERTVVEKPVATVPAPSTVTYVDPAPPASTVVYTR
jgi:hypothetical protein